MRYPCIDCARKHIAQAIVLLNETFQGYPDHRWLAIGHLAEAADELIADKDFEPVAVHLRQERLRLQEDFEYRPLLMPYIEMLSAQDGVETETGATQESDET